jgi:hypothetical protein
MAFAVEQHNLDAGLASKGSVKFDCGVQTREGAAEDQDSRVAHKNPSVHSDPGSERRRRT